MKRLASLIIVVLLTALVIGSLMMGKNPKSPEKNKKAQTTRHDQYFKMNLGTEPPTLDPAEADDLISITVL